MNRLRANSPSPVSQCSYVTSDCGALAFLVTAQHYSKTDEDAAVAALSAGEVHGGAQPVPAVERSAVVCAHTPTRDRTRPRDRSRTTAERQRPFPLCSITPLTV